jgi:hypothetical protein
LRSFTHSKATVFQKKKATILTIQKLCWSFEERNKEIFSGVLGEKVRPVGSWLTVYGTESYKSTDPSKRRILD